MTETQVRTPYTTLAIGKAEGLMFGRAPKPVSCGYGLELGSGTVYPEINFTLPMMMIDESTWTSVVAQYDEMGEMIGRTAKRLHLKGVMIEFELLPPMTERPEWGAEITRVLDRHLKTMYENHGIAGALRVTPTDIRDARRPPLLRSGIEWETLMASFDACAKAGAHVLSIESVGGKEVNDEAMMYGDVEGVIFVLGVLAPRDMGHLWTNIVSTCESYGVVPGGDSACGFANTAMQLASQGMLPEVLAAMIRGASAVRSLVAYECGAFGPSKDCAYEGPILKAITGAPIAMEGKSSSCAHFSPVGNVAAAMCDLWSNESVQNIRLLSGSAPEAFLELLTYDCRLFNAALSSGSERTYQRMLVDSDVHHSPQALVLSPDATIRIASAIVREQTPYRQTVAAGLESLHVIRDAVRDRTLPLSAKEHHWLDKTESALTVLPTNEGGMIDSMIERYGHLFTPSSYGL